jgi:hypothetical protein
MRSAAARGEEADLVRARNGYGGLLEVIWGLGVNWRVPREHSVLWFAPYCSCEIVVLRIGGEG